MATNQQPAPQPEDGMSLLIAMLHTDIGAAARARDYKAIDRLLDILDRTVDILGKSQEIMLEKQHLDIAGQQANLVQSVSELRYKQN